MTDQRAPIATEDQFSHRISLLTVLVGSFLFWLAFGLLLGIAELYGDVSKARGDISTLLLMKYMLAYLPLASINALLAYFFWRNAEIMLKKKMLLIVPTLLLLLGLPLQTFGKTLVFQLFEDQPLAMLFQNWLKYPAFGLWLQACFILFIFMSQITYAIWWRSMEKRSELGHAENERIALRLHLLQGQLKPHFLFNALHSIGGLARRDDRRTASHALIQLHGLLNYVIDASRQDFSNVAQEIQFVRDYIEMQRLRFGERMQLSLNIEQRDWSSIACPPLLFQPLIENAIHHGVELHHEVCYLQLNLRLDHGKVRFQIENSISPDSEPRKGRGLGLSNTRERLHLRYRERATLICQMKHQQFVVDLSFPAEASSHTDQITRCE